MKNLFLPDATENNMDINQAMDMYRSNFNKHKIIRYDIQIKNKSVKGDNAFVDGNFVVIYKNNNDEKVSETAFLLLSVFKFLFRISLLVISVLSSLLLFFLFLLPYFFINEFILSIVFSS